MPLRILGLLPYIAPRCPSPLDYQSERQQLGYQPGTRTILGRHDIARSDFVSSPRNSSISAARIRRSASIAFVEQLPSRSHMIFGGCPSRKLLSRKASRHPSSPRRVTNQLLDS